MKRRIDQKSRVTTSKVLPWSLDASSRVDASRVVLGCIQGSTLDFRTFTLDQTLPGMDIITDRHK